MPGTASPTRAELIEQICERVRSRVEPALQPLTERFLRCLYRDVPPSDMADRSLDDLYGAGLALWRFGQTRPAGEPRLRVYNPSLDRNGWRCSHTVVEIVNDDMPFLVDSVLAELQRRDCQVLLVVHPVLWVERDAEGALVEVAERVAGGGQGPGRAESFMQLQITQQHDDRHAAIEEGLAGVLADVRSAVGAWAAMRARCHGLIEELTTAPPPHAGERVAEAVELLRWMVEDRFTFLGYRELRLERARGGAVRVRHEPGLGLLEEPEAPLFAGIQDGRALPADLAQHFLEPKLVRIAKAHRRSTVHRAVHLDTVSVKRFDGAGRVVGERLFAGLFTQEAYSQSPRVIPVLSRKVANILERSGLPPDSHDGRALLHILETYPRDELFQATEEELHATSIAILNLQDRSRVAFFPRRDPFGRFVSAIVYLPRDRYDTRMRRRLEQILSDAYQGEIDRFYTHLSDSALARLHFIVRSGLDEGEAPPAEEIEAQMVAAARSWEDLLTAELVQEMGEAHGGRLALRYARAFPIAYQERHSEQVAVGDVRRLEEAVETGELAINLYRPMEAQPHEARLKLYLRDRARLSDVVPMLENMGLDVIDEQPYQIGLPELDHPLWIRDFSLQAADGRAIELSSVRDHFHETLRRVWRGEAEDDGFNRLVLTAGLDPMEVNLLRAYARYLRQLRIPFSLSYMQATLYRNPRIARLLVDLFERRFDPETQSDADERTAETASLLEERLEEVESLDEDRILRRFLNAVLSTVRTNFYLTDADGQPRSYLSFKLDSRALDNLPLPRPFREIWVFSPRVEAIHLRGGKVARGGIRWSDRREDFRTEIVGLMKAQMVKNAVIVPVGAKGGFVVKRPPSGSREELQEEVRHCYRTMIRGLLDLTDNLQGDRVVPPERVVRRDDDDPYLVVAADKGTATFSDLANSISAEYGFWLGDAFASGGSAGYDHKKMGITARGAWESVKRHFRELGKDIQSEPFTVVGVGDMAGDVFGNGMLLSRGIRLLGAFNHLHVFVDPDPDPELSWAERKRLFDLPGSTWADYDPARLSPGGGVFERRAKAIEPSAEIRALLGIDVERITPSELIKKLLTARVDLLWFGGIGTFVKASTETDAQVDDRANDAVRVDADDLQAKVVGEGANLGMTQRGRIEYSLGGGRVNTDSIDNSAGVDCSDHEVNIKILLGEVEANGDLTRKRRDQLLAQMTDEVAELVLRDNYLQTQAISVTHQLGAHLLDRVARFMRELERRRRLDRRFENLPDDDLLAERLAQGVGFTRPEVAVLLSYAKLDLAAELLGSDLPDDPSVDGDLKRYFPRQIRKLYGGRVPRHRLRREIAATLLTNEIINRGGIAFVHEVRERTGATAAEVARAFMVGREVFDLPETWAAIEALDGRAPSTLQASMLADCGRLIERETVWFLRSGESLDDVDACIAAYRERVKELYGRLDRLITEADRRMLEQRARGLAEQGAPPALARRIASLPLLAPAADIVRVARQRSVGVLSVGGIHFAVGSRFGFDWLRRAAGRLPTDSAWDKQAINAIVDDLSGHQTELTKRVLESARGRKVDLDLIESWGEARRARVARTEQLLAELQSVATPSLAMLAVANRQLKSLAT